LKIQEKQLRKLGDTPNGDTNHLKPNIEHHQIAVGYDFELEVYGIPDFELEVYGIPVNL